ncbi:hypothetical protein KSP40_PGU022409 [Platanthera guangdongensis]|uniref:Uncharacterized protein n=1 Tax=Platanthera guangdongensis TaxID=2320717 RepID=A0ABR2MBW7_9ASPA
MRGKALRFSLKARSAMINHQLPCSPHSPISSSTSVLAGSLHPNTTTSAPVVVVHSSVAEQKRALRSIVRKELRSLPIHSRIQEGILSTPFSFLCLHVPFVSLFSDRIWSGMHSE